MQAVYRLGADSVPIVSKGDKFVYAQSLQDVAAFLGLDVEFAPKLTPAELADKMDMVLAAAGRYWRQVPDDALARKLPNRNRTYRQLAHHIFRIPEAFLEAVGESRTLTNEMLTEDPPPDMRTSAQIADYGESVRKRFRAWWLGLEDVSGEQTVPTYFGEHPLHDVLERTAWHSAQHVRQTMMLMETMGIRPDRPLTMEDLKGLPVPEKVWDDEPGATAG